MHKIKINRQICTRSRLIRRYAQDQDVSVDFHKIKINLWICTRSRFVLDLNNIKDSISFKIIRFKDLTRFLMWLKERSRILNSGFACSSTTIQPNTDDKCVHSMQCTMTKIYTLHSKKKLQINLIKKLESSKTLL